MTRSEAVLITGLYGSGKSSLVEELAELLEAADVSFGAIDVDWLYWYHLPGTPDDETRLGAANLTDVATRYVDSGVRYLLLASAVRHDEDLEGLRRAVPCPLRVVLLDTPFEVIEQRLQGVPTSGRARDLEAARDWKQRGLGLVAADLTLPGDAPLQESASRVMGWLGWLGAS